MSTPPHNNVKPAKLNRAGRTSAASKGYWARQADPHTKVALGGMTVATLSQTTSSLPAAVEAGMLTVGAVVALVGILVGLGSKRRLAAAPVNASS